jgi:FkbM family methyltransferase
MSFVSYAQNFEDVLLWRALSDVSGGCYVDVGAQDPDIDSVSRAFHERGWHGIHIEPNAAYARALRLKRPGDTVLECALGASAGSLVLHEIASTGLSTLDPVLARQHAEQGFEVKPRTVPVRTLDAVFDELGSPEVHWLKIDVEGLEGEVLQGWQQSTVRPWVVVIESTRPLSREQSHASWEALILAKGYDFAWFDGLNRYYVHESRRDRIARLAIPPNVFDGFELAGQASHPFCWRLNHRIALLDQELGYLTQIRRELQADNARLRQQIWTLAAQLHEARTAVQRPIGLRGWIRWQVELLRRDGWRARAAALVRRLMARLRRPQARPAAAPAASQSPEIGPGLMNPWPPGQHAQALAKRLLAQHKD